MNEPLGFHVERDDRGNAHLLPCTTPLGILEHGMGECPIDHRPGGSCCVPEVLERDPVTDRRMLLHRLALA